MVKIFIYDFETFQYDWLVVFQDYETGELQVFHNDGEALLNFMDPNAIYCGFNTKSYDRFIMNAVCCGCDNFEVKELNDYIIAGGNGWEHPLTRDLKYRFNNVDVRDDMQAGLSLKAIEGHLGMSIEESSVPFDIDRPLTEAELQETIFYCRHDVEATAELVKLRKDYFNTKIDVGRMAGIDEVTALSMTNAKLTAAFLKAQRPLTPWTDERQYKYPENLKREYIPQEVFDFFDRMYDPNVSDEELFSSKLEIEIGGTPTTIGFGGIHSAIPNYHAEHDDCIIRNFDVASYYPHLMTINGYTSRNIPDAKIYSDMLEKRMAAKKAGDKKTANALKLIANTTYGAMLNEYNDLYDPLMARSVCISGQLYLLELSCHLHKEVPGLTIAQTNTDGIMVRFPRKHKAKVGAIVKEWQERTKFELEEDDIASITQKDVNGYIEVGMDGTVKKKGGYLVRGIAPAGAFNINNNASIIATALVEYFAKGVPVEETIGNCQDIAQFMMIAKAGSKYREAFQIIDGEKVPTQKTNRVYAIADTRYGTLYKVKDATSGVAKIESLPEHCVIDNSAVTDPNHIKVDSIDKQWYIDLAHKRINDFMGIEPEKTTKVRTAKVATTKTPENVLQKLLRARKKFLDEGIKKSGINNQMEFQYFELADIIPTATAIFEEVGILPLVYMDSDMAYMDMVNTDNREDKLTFSIPLAKWEGNRGVNPIQVMGATVTYYRRYLYQIALDIVERDEIDDKPQVAVTPDKPTAPATPQQRVEIKAQLTNVEGQADELQLKQLKESCKALKAKTKGTDVEQEVNDWLTKLALESKGFTVISRANCADALTHIAKTLEALENG